MLGCLDAEMDAGGSKKKLKKTLRFYAPSLMACYTFKFEQETCKEEMSNGGTLCKSSWHLSVRAEPMLSMSTLTAAAV